MADICDITQDREIPTEALVAASRRPEGPKATGCCLSCGEQVPPEHRWCNSPCWEDWSRVQSAKARNGGR